MGETRFREKESSLISEHAKKQDTDGEKTLNGSLKLSHATPAPLFITVPASLHTHSDGLGLR